MRCDVLIVGAGVAGLAVAAYLAEQVPVLHIAVLSKASWDDSNSAHAQGGIAAVFNIKNDSFHRHFEDTMRCGGAASKAAMVRLLVHEAPGRVEDLMAWGAHFDCNPQGEPSCALEGGHSAARIVHHKDQTGREIIATLKRRVSSMPNVVVLLHRQVVGLESEMMAGQKACTGAVVVDPRSGSSERISARITVLATGGCCQVYARSTNPLGATGDGLALAHALGARLCNLQYMQFHPTALYSTTDNPLFLITEALRGAGAVLRDAGGKRFMQRYDPRAELATRDVVSAAMLHEMAAARVPHLWLDARRPGSKVMESHFPAILTGLRARGIDPFGQWIPVVPAAHYQCGGIDVDRFGRSSVPRLYAVGECAHTGVQGENRLASNSLSEGLVFAKCMAEHLKSELSQVPAPAAHPVILGYMYSLAANAEARSLRSTLQDTMLENAGPAASTVQLQGAIIKLLDILKQCKGLDNRALEVIALKHLTRTALHIAEHKYHHSLRTRQNTTPHECT